MKASPARSARPSGTRAIRLRTASRSSSSRPANRTSCRRRRSPGRPKSRARLWNYNHTDGNIGTAFVALPSTTINVTDKFASEVARLNPTRAVYLINTAMAFSGNRISHWLPGTSAPDEYLQITNNVPAALAAIGATKIDLLLWWQGEAQTPATSQVYQYPADWQTFHSRLLAGIMVPAGDAGHHLRARPHDRLRLDRHRRDEWQVAGGGPQ